MQKDFIGGSFRDPSAREIFREIYHCYNQKYEKLMNCGLYYDLLNNQQLVMHQEVSLKEFETPEKYEIIQPEHIPFISYPYEWSFSQLKDVALLTLSIHKKASEFGMSLKDALENNIQFLGCKTIFIDTLSFKIYVEGKKYLRLIISKIFIWLLRNSTRLVKKSQLKVRIEQ